MISLDDIVKVWQTIARQWESPLFFGKTNALLLCHISLPLPPTNPAPNTHSSLPTSNLPNSHSDSLQTNSFKLALQLGARELMESADSGVGSTEWE